jgi:hypothetical protein
MFTLGTHHVFANAWSEVNSDTKVCPRLDSPLPHDDLDYASLEYCYRNYEKAHKAASLKSQLYGIAAIAFLVFALTL